jgi:uncharacterized membrane protein YgdD (TMEM256/DUF423 family)
MNKLAFNAACVFGILAVIIGAMGAHALRPYLTPDQQVSFETAVKYQFYHALALGLVAIVHYFKPNQWVRTAAWLFMLGIILFSGSIYLLIYLKATGSIGLGGLGIITPIGGMLMIAGWLSLLMGGNKK